VKVYDEAIRAFKLNDIVTIVGVLEFSTPAPAAPEEKDTPPAASQDSHMTEVE